MLQLAEAIAYVWMTEGTYEKNFIELKTHGFDAWKTHILGDEDEIPRTPAWAAELTGIEEALIWALAREWAKKKYRFRFAERVALGRCAHRTAYGA